MTRQKDAGRRGRRKTRRFATFGGKTLNPVRFSTMRLVDYFGLILLLLESATTSNGYRHSPCVRSIARQLGSVDCYLPPLSGDLQLSEASFLLSHDSGTGYLSTRHPLAPYAKNQVGSAYRQLQDGARALDVRPKLLNNGTIVLQHGAVTIQTSLADYLRDVTKWCQENSDELVLLLPANPIYSDVDNYLDTLSAVYSTLGINAVSCTDVEGWTIADAMAASALPNGGYLLAFADTYFCGKSNWIESKAVTCYSYHNSDGTLVSNVRCTNPSTSQPEEALHQYVLASANNEATDDWSNLGPPSDTSTYPFSEVQALWQVDSSSAVAGLAHLSTILQDNRRSKLHERLIGWIYEQEFSQINLLAVDNVHFHGLSLLAVLRHQCGQTTEATCGKQLEPPRLKRYVPPFFVVWVISCAAMVVVAVRLRRFVLSSSSSSEEGFQYNNFGVAA